MSGAALARQLDWPKPRLHRIEHGDQKASLADAVALCNALDIDPREAHKAQEGAA